MLKFKVACLKSLSKDDIISFYTHHIASTKSRKKLSCHVVSTCETDAEENDSSTAVEELSVEESSLLKSPDTHLITDVTSFKLSIERIESINVNEKEKTSCLHEFSLF